MQQNRPCRNKATCIWSANLSQDGQLHSIGRESSTPKMIMGKQDTHTQTHQVKCDHNLAPYTKTKCKTKTVKLHKENIRKKLLDICLDILILNLTPKAWASKQRQTNEVSSLIAKINSSYLILFPYFFGGTGV